MPLQNALELTAVAFLSECLLHFPSVFVPVLLRVFTAGQSDVVSWKLARAVVSFPDGWLY